MKKINQIWSNRKSILEGLKNNIFKTEHVEQIAAERKAICQDCSSLDEQGKSCLVSGTQPCCSECGCSLQIKLRSLSAACGNEKEPKWHALLSQEEEDAFINQLKPNQDGNNIQSGNA